ncbi:MAG: class III poly(R)-hydroxyalkanoic acid synthase subunit PhaC [Planctomycetes bacterium]|nr:class III poly(R)-hydroxyalkanoic acid synthase subunit PhaC [Planctomycetota bacterium]
MPEEKTATSGSPVGATQEKPKFNVNEELDRFQKRLIRGMEVLTSPLLDVEVATTPSELVYQEDKMRIFRYIPVQKKLQTPPVLISYALVNRQYMLDLQPDRSVIRYLLNQGIDVYIIDWGYPTPIDRYITLEDYIEGYLNNAVEEVLRRSGASKLNLVGICQGGTFSVMYSALHPEKIKNLVTIVTPVDFDTDTGLLNIWSRNLYVDKVVDTMGNVPGDFMNVGFLLMNPFRLVLDKYIGFMLNIDDQNFVNNFVRMEKWIFDSPDQAGECWKQFIRDCYQKNLLIQNKLKVGDKTVNLQNITMPVLNIFAEYDHLVPPACSRNFTEHIGSTDKEIASFPTGHIGIFVSARSQKEICPRLSEWLIKRSE